MPLYDFIACCGKWFKKPVSEFPADRPRSLSAFLRVCNIDFVCWSHETGSKRNRFRCCKLYGCENLMGTWIGGFGPMIKNSVRFFAMDGVK